MKSFIFLLFFVNFVFCEKPAADLNYSTETLEKLNQYTHSLKQSGTSFTTGNLSIEPEDVSLIVYTRAHPEGTEVQLTDANQLTSVSPFDINLKTVFFAHGWTETVEAESNRLVRTSHLQVEDVNVIIINWDKCATNEIYFASQKCVPEVGKYVGEFIETMSQTYGYSKADIKLVGHSLGAHIVGNMGKNTNGEIGIIVGLDPAGPFYFQDSTDRLAETDARFVHAFHTCSLFFGVSFSLGDVDFWPNGGLTQPGCDDLRCSHRRAYQFYVESVTNNQFYGRKCDSYKNFESRNCSENEKALMAGANINTGISGEFYLDTNSKSPYGMGDVV